MVSAGQKVFKGVKVITVMEAALILSSAEMQIVLEQRNWVLEFKLSELRGDRNHGEPVELQGEKIL